MGRAFLNYESWIVKSTSPQSFHSTSVYQYTGDVNSFVLGQFMLALGVLGVARLFWGLE